MPVGSVSWRGIVLAAGYRGYVGIEYEGRSLPEDTGILATKKLLEKVRAKAKKELKVG